jgi:glycosyltransferase involved in cell wall biosynthesis
MSEPKISCCIITAGESTLESAVASIRPHVDEVVILRAAGLESVARFEEIAALADKVGDCSPECLYEDGTIRDFAKARNESFALASHEFVCWMDSDDTVVGGENIRPTIAKFVDAPRVRLLAKYEYAVDPRTGEVLVEQWRERIVKRSSGPGAGGDVYRWDRPAHEYLIAVDGNNGDVELETVKWVHHRSPNQPWSPRNLRILEDYRDRVGMPGTSDPWLHLNLALELHRGGRHEEALVYFDSYAQVSDNEAERVMALAIASECAYARGPFDFKWQEEAIRWARLAGTGFSALYAEAKVQFVRGVTGDEKALRRARDLFVRALDLPPSHTPYATSPVHRKKDAPGMLRQTCENLCDWRGAADATRRLIESYPDDAMLKLHLKRYEQLEKVEAGEHHPATSAEGLDIVFACGPTIETWNPRTMAEKGIGGSETAVVEMSRRLAQLGRRVRVITDCGEDGCYDGVWWLQTPHVNGIGECDVAIVWRNAALLDYCKGAKARIVWAHDVRVANMTPERALWSERVLGLSDWHCVELRKAHGLHPSQVVRTRNGIDLDRFHIALSDESKRDRKKVLYTSSPDRGLAVLLDVWPFIRKSEPEATLDVYYGFGGFDDAVKRTGDQQWAYVSHMLKEKLRELSVQGVRHFGRVDQATLAKAMLGAGVWAYPTWGIMETSCIGAQEAQAAGMRIVTSKIAALPETVGDRGVLIEGDWLSGEYQQAFVNEVLNAMGELDSRGRPGSTERSRLKQYARENFSWDGVVSQWVELFDEVLTEAESGVLVPFQSAL